MHARAGNSRLRAGRHARQAGLAPVALAFSGHVYTILQKLGFVPMAYAMVVLLFSHRMRCPMLQNLPTTEIERMKTLEKFIAWAGVFAWAPAAVAFMVTDNYLMVPVAALVGWVCACLADEVI